MVPDLYSGTRSLPVKLNKKQLGKIISHLIEIQNEDESSDDDDNVDPQGNYSGGRLTVVPEQLVNTCNFESKILPYIIYHSNNS